MHKQDRLTLQRDLTHWYDAVHRKLPWRLTRDPYRIWVSEVMLQQTRVETVIPYYEAFIRRFPRVSRLARADLEQVLKGWEGLGYYSRARNLHRAAQLIVNRWEGELPRTLDGLRSLPGIGEYIAAAVGSIAFDLPAAVVDGNVKRILARIFAEPAPVNANGAKKRFTAMAASLLDPTQPGRFNQALMELGQRICTPKNPQCTTCPIASHCQARRKNMVDQLPVRLSKKKVPVKHLAHVVIHRRDTWLILRRQTKGLLGGLWEFPGGECPGAAMIPGDLIGLIRGQTGIIIAGLQQLGEVQHAYTHFRVSAQVYHGRFDHGRIRLADHREHAWIHPHEMGKYAFHKLIHKMMPLLETV